MSIKTEIENYLIRSYKLNYSDEIIYHPVKIVQSVKSLIGINPEIPNKKLLEFIPKYLSSFKKNESQNDEIVQVEYFASMINLEILLKEKKYSEAKTEIIRLLQVSTGEPILELIILIHLHNIHVLPFLNSIYRAVKFCNGKDVKIAILLMIEILQEISTLNENLSEIQFIDYITHINEIQNTKFIRNDEFNNEMQKIDYQFIYTKFETNNKSKLGEKLIKNGRKELLEFVNENSTLSFNYENIIILDSIRTFLHYRKSNEFDFLIYYASNLLEENIG